VGDAIDFFPDSSSLGLWGFSTNRTASTDWSDLVPLGPLSDMVGSRTRRSALTVAARALPSQVRGGTGLYRTTLAAYDAVRSGYDPKSLNSVVLLTDGYNSERHGPSLADLLRNLRGAADPARPLPIITVAFGLRTDTATLRQIAAATRGRTYVAARPGDLRDALLDALINAA
jgi:hypothetical protein